jgi:hypothetical protein
MTTIRLIVILLLSLTICEGASKKGLTPLLASTYRMGILSEVGDAGTQFCREAPPAIAEQVEAEIGKWQTTLIGRIREQLTAAYGETAKETLQVFVTSYSAAEAAGDRDFLANLLAAVEAPAHLGYPELRRYALTHWLAEDVKGASAFLGDMETWLALSMDEETRQELPPLSAWIAREEMVVLPPKRPRSLRDAEASSGTFVAPSISDANPLDMLSNLHSERRADALRQAEVGMSMVTAERQAAEDELAAKKLQQAQADATALKKQAMVLASAEKDAMAQRENSWGNRLKKIVGATATAAGGTFFGHVGAEAGRAAVDAIF